MRWFVLGLFFVGCSDPETCDPLFAADYQIARTGAACADISLRWERADTISSGFIAFDETERCTGMIEQVGCSIVWDLECESSRADTVFTTTFVGEAHPHSAVPDRLVGMNTSRKTTEDGSVVCEGESQITWFRR